MFVPSDPLMFVTGVMFVFVAADDGCLWPQTRRFGDCRRDVCVFVAADDWCLSSLGNRREVFVFVAADDWCLSPQTR